jgi:hypothetical protein
MKKYAVLNSDNVVYNIIVAGSLETAEQATGSNCVAIPVGTFCDMGKFYSNGAFIDVPAEEVVELPTPPDADKLDHPNLR